MKMEKWLVAVVIVCLFPISASAAWERTVAAWDPCDADQGELQFSLWNFYDPIDYEGWEYDGIGDYLLINYGIKSNWSVGIEFGYGFYEESYNGVDYSENGLTDTVVMTNYRFMNEGTSGLDLSVRGALSIPTGDEDEGFGSDKWEPRLWLLGAKHLGSVLLVGNIGVQNIMDPEEDQEDFVFDSILEGVFPLTDRLSFSAFAYYYTSRWETSTDDDYLDLGTGIKYVSDGGMFISASVGNCVSSDIYDWYYGLSFGISFK